MFKKWSNYFLFHCIRTFSTKAEERISKTIPNPLKTLSNMIGPVDPVSNLRPIVYRQRPDESVLEKRFREERIEVQRWNHNFWKTHNETFFQEKENFMKKGTDVNQQLLTPDEMSVFYKAFLDKNWRTHVEYNKCWYKKNMSLLLLSIRVKLYKMYKQFQM